MEIAVTIAAVAVTVLCGVIAIAVIVTLPKVWRILGNVETASASAAKVTADLADVSPSIAANLDAAATDTAKAASNAEKTTGDFAVAAANIRALSSLDVRAIVMAVAQGNLSSVKDLARLVAEKGWVNLPNPFRRGGN